MDEKDAAIIKFLARMSGLSSRTVSKMLGLPISTVHRRIKKLEKDGIIMGYKALVNFEKTAWPIGALIQINLAEAAPGRGTIPKIVILQTLENFEEIEEIIDVQAANFDLIAKARFESLRKLSEFIENLRQIEGIEETSAAIITEETLLPPIALRT